MRAYHVRVFLPQVIEIQAEDEVHALEKVGAYYQEQYAKAVQDWLEPLVEPEEHDWLMPKVYTGQSMHEEELEHRS